MDKSKKKKNYRISLQEENVPTIEIMLIIQRVYGPTLSHEGTFVSLIGLIRLSDDKFHVFKEHSQASFSLLYLQLELCKSFLTFHVSLPNWIPLFPSLGMCWTEFGSIGLVSHMPSRLGDYFLFIRRAV